jgi:ferredoxin
VHLQVADEVGRADLSAWRPEEPATRVYACGPERLLDEIETWAVSGRGLPPRTERFTASAAALAGPSMHFQVHAARSGVTETVDPGESIIVALRRGGVDILNSCGQGVCGTCETAVLEGTPDHRDTLLDDRERAEGRCRFPCVSRCVGDRIVLDL